jgi:hypothetical protein
MPTEDLQALYLDDDQPLTALATVRASTCSRTSCALRIEAPRS